MATNKSTKSAKKSDSKLAPKELESKINLPIAEASASQEDKAILDQMEADWLKRKQDEQIAEEEIKAGNKILLADASNSSTVVDAATTDCDAKYQEPDATGQKDKHASKDAHNKACGITEEVTNYGMLAAILGGVGIAAAAAGGGSGGGGAPAIPEGTVVDGPVRNVLVFRDEDGDGKWFDADGDGRWDSGDEYIVVTDSNGDYRNLGGSGGTLVAVGLGQLTGVSDDDSERSYDSIVDSRGATVTGPAIDNETNLPFTGVFMAPATSLISGELPTITAVSSLVTFLLKAEGLDGSVGNVPTSEQIIEKAQLILNAFINPQQGIDAGGLTAAETIQFFIGGNNVNSLLPDSLNHQLYSLIATVGSDAANNNQNVGDAINAFLEALADAVIELDALDNADEDEGNNVLPLDLSDIDDLETLFNTDAFTNAGYQFSPEDLEAFTESVATGGVSSGAVIYFEPVDPSVFDFDISENKSATYDAIDGFVLTISGNNVPVSDVTVIASLSGDTDGSHDVSVVMNSVDTDVDFVNSTINVIAKAEGQSAYLSLAGDEYDHPITDYAIDDITVRAISDYSDAYVNLEVDGRVAGDIQVLADGFDAQAGLFMSPYTSGDTSLEFLGGSIDVEAVGGDVAATLIINDASGDLGHINVDALNQSEDSYAVAIASVDLSAGDNINGDITVDADNDSDADESGARAAAIAFIAAGGDVNGSVDLSATNYGDAYVNNEYADAYATAGAGLFLNVSGDINGDVTVSTLNYGDASTDVYDAVTGNSGTEAYTYAYTFATINVGESLDGNLDVSTTNYGDAYVNGDFVYSDVVHTINSAESDDVAGYVSDTGAYSYTSVYVGGEINGDVSINSENYGDVTIYGSDVSSDVYAANSADVDVELDGILADATTYTNVYVEVGDSIIGNVDINTLNNGDLTIYGGDVSADVEAYSSADVDVNVNGYDAEASAYTTVYMNIGGDIDGSLDITTVNNGDAYVDGGYVYTDIYTATSADANVDVYGYNAVVSAVTSADINVGGDIDGNVTISSLNSGDADTNPYASIYHIVDANSDSTVYASINGYSVEVNAETTVALTVSDDVNGNLDVSAINTGDADIRYGNVSSNIDAVGSDGVNTSINAFASQVSSSTFTNISVSGDVNGEINVSALNIGNVEVYEADGAVANTHALNDSEINVGGSVDGDVTISAYNSGDADVDYSDNSSATNAAITNVNMYIGQALNGDLLISSENSGDADINTSNGSVANVYASADVDITVGGSLLGSIDVFALNTGDADISSGAANDADAGASMHAHIAVSGDVEGDITVVASNSGDAEINDDYDYPDSGAAGVYADADVTITVGGDVNGSVDIAASNIGDALVSNYGSGVADIYSTVEVVTAVDLTVTSGDINGDIELVAYNLGSADAQGNDIDTYVSHSSNYDYSSNINGYDSDVSVATNVTINVESGDVNGDVSILAFNSGSADIDGDDVEVTVDNNSTYEVYVTNDGFSSTVSSSTNATINIGGDLNGSIDILSRNEGNAYITGGDVSSDVYGTADADVNTTLYGFEAVIDTNVNATMDVDGQVNGSINLDAVNDGSVDVYLSDVSSEVDLLNGAWINTDIDGAFASTASSATLDLTVGEGINGSIDITATNLGDAYVSASDVAYDLDDTATSADLDPDIYGVDVDVTASASANITVESGDVTGSINIAALNNGDAEINANDVYVDALVGTSADLNADIYGYRIDVNADTQFTLVVESGDIVGNITIGATNNGDSQVYGDDAYTDFSAGISSDVDIDFDGYDAFVSASTNVNIDVTGDIIGNISIAALNNGSADIEGNNVFATLSAGYDASVDVDDLNGYEADAEAYTDANINVTGNVIGNIDITSLNNGSAEVDSYGYDVTSYINATGSDHVDVNIDAYEVLTNAATTVTLQVSGDIEGSLNVGATNNGHADLDGDDVNATVIAGQYANVSDPSIEAFEADVYAYTYAYVDVGANVSGDINITALNNGDAYIDGEYVDATVNASTSADIDYLYVEGYEADVESTTTVYMNVSGDITGNLNISAENNGDADIYGNDVSVNGTLDTSADAEVVILGYDADVHAATSVNLVVGEDVVGDIAISAANYGYAYAYGTNTNNNLVNYDPVDNITGEDSILSLNITGSEASVYASTDVEISVAGDVTGSIDVSSSNTGDAEVIYSDQSSAYAFAYTNAQISVGGSLDGDVVISAYNSGDADVNYGDDNYVEAYAETFVNLSVSYDVTGNLTISSENSGDASVYDADDTEAYAYAYTSAQITVGGSLDGEVVISAYNSGDADVDYYSNSYAGTSAETYVNLSVSQDLTGNLTISAENSGDANVFEASGSDAYAYAYTTVDVNVGGDLSGDISISALNTGVAGIYDGDASYAEAYASTDVTINVTGSLNGQIDIDATNEANATIELVDDTDSNHFVNTEAYTYVNISVDVNISGDITIESNNSGNVYVDGGYVGVSHNAGSYSYVDSGNEGYTAAITEVDLAVSGDIYGNLDIIANNTGNAVAYGGAVSSYVDAESYEVVNVDLTGSYVTSYAYTDVQVSVSSDIEGNIDISASNIGDATANSGSVYSDVNAYTSSDVYVDVSGDTVEAWAETYVDLNVDGNVLGNISVTSNNSGDAAANGGSVYSDVYATSSGDADSYAFGNDVSAWARTELDMYVGQDISGDITIGSNNTGDATTSYGVVTEYASSGNIWSTAYSEAYGNYIETSASTDVQIDVVGQVDGNINITANNSGIVDISSSDVATGYAYAYTNADINIGEDLIGDITADATNTGHAIVRLISDSSDAEAFAYVSTDIHVGDDVIGDITFTALNEGDAFVGNLSGVSSITYARNDSNVHVSDDFTGDVTLTSINRGNVIDFGGTTVITTAVVQSDIVVEDFVNTNIDISATNEGIEGSAVAGLQFTGGSGDIHTVNLDAADITYDDSGWAAVYFGLNQGPTAFDGGIGEMNVSVGDNASASADINLEEYIDTLNIVGNDSLGTSEIDISVSQDTHGGDVYVNNYGDVDTTFWLAYEEATADRIYLGSYLNESDQLTAGEFDSGSLLDLGIFMADRDLNIDDYNPDLSVNSDYELLINSMLTIYGGSSGEESTAQNFEIYFNNLNGGLLYDTDIDTDGGGGDTDDFYPGINNGYYEYEGYLANINEFLGMAQSMINAGNDYVFGVVGNDGYLAYDQDNNGMTMLIQFDDLTTFSSSLINNQYYV